MTVDQRTIAWSTVIILLVLGAGALFPIGTNVTPELVLDLPGFPHSRVRAMDAKGNHVLVLLNDRSNERLGVVRLEVKAAEAPGDSADVSIEEPLWLPMTDRNSPPLVHDMAWSLDDRSLAYVLISQNVSTGDEYGPSHRLLTLRLDNAAAPVVHQQDITSLLSEGYCVLSASVDQGKLYVYGQQTENRLLVFSLDAPESPELTGQETVPRLGFDGPRHSRNTLTHHQIGTAVPDPSKRFDITYDLTRRHSWPWSETQQDRVVAFTADWVLTLFEKEKVDTDRTVLKAIAYRPRLAIQKLLGLGYASVIDSVGPWTVTADGLGVTLYRIGDTNEIHRVGHYAGGKGFGDMLILPDKYLILGNDRLHILELADDDG